MKIVPPGVRRTRCDRSEEGLDLDGRLRDVHRGELDFDRRGTDPQVVAVTSNVEQRVQRRGEGDDAPRHPFTRALRSSVAPT